MAKGGGFALSQAASGVAGYFTADLTLVAVVPEPSVGVILLGGIGMLLAARRRRRE